MKKKKKPLSLTSKERKEMRGKMSRNKEDSKEKRQEEKQEKVVFENETVKENNFDAENIETNENTQKSERVYQEPITDNVGSIKAKKPLTRKNILTIGIASILAFIILLSAIIVGFVVVPSMQYSHISNPVAVIKLDNGQEIELEIYEDKVPDIATNFIYLCQIGFFDDTIIFDTTNGYVRFGQYEDYDSYRTENADFISKLDDDYEEYVDNPFDYRLYSDSSDTASQYSGRDDEKMYVSLAYNLSGVDFQICTDSSQPINVNAKDSTSTTIQDMSGYVFAMILNSDSYDVACDIADMEQVENNGHSFWSGPAETIKIKTIKLYNLDKSKWNNFDFWEYFYEGDTTKIKLSGGSGFVS